MAAKKSKGVVEDANKSKRLGVTIVSSTTIETAASVGASAKKKRAASTPKKVTENSSGGKSKQWGAELIRCAKKGDVEGCEKAISKGADLGFQEETLGRTALMVILAKGQGGALAHLLVSAMDKAELDGEDNGCLTAMDYAVQSKMEDKVVACLIEAMASRGADVEGCADDGNVTTLMIAARMSESAAIHALLEAGADPSRYAVTEPSSPCPITEQQKGSALEVAMANENKAAARVLAPVSSHDFTVDGTPPLSLACQWGDLDLVRAFLNKQTAMLRDGRNRLPMEYVYSFRDNKVVPIIKELLRFADPWVVGSNGTLPLQWSTQSWKSLGKEADEEVTTLIADAMMSSARPDYAKLAAFSKVMGVAELRDRQGVVSALGNRIRVLEDRLAMKEDLSKNNENTKEQRVMSPRL